MTTPKSNDKQPGGDAGQAEVQARSDEATEQGFIGTRPDGPDNSAWSLESGPDAPSAYELARNPAPRPAQKKENRK